MTRKDKINLINQLLNGDKQAIKQLKAKTKRIDFSKLSDEELQAIINKSPPLSPEKQAYWSSFTDEELYTIIETGQLPKEA